METESYVPKIVRNEFFYFIARLCMILSLPIGGYVATRAIAQADEIKSQLQVQSIQLQILSATVKQQLDSDTKTLSDHELRIRGLERGK